MSDNSVFEIVNDLLELGSFADVNREDSKVLDKYPKLVIDKNAVENIGKCKKCGRELDFNDYKCCHCKHIKEQREEKKARTIYFKKLNKLTIEQRIRLIEEWIYEYKPPDTTWESINRPLI